MFFIFNLSRPVCGFIVNGLHVAWATSDSPQNFATPKLPCSTRQSHSSCARMSQRHFVIKVSKHSGLLCLAHYGPVTLAHWCQSMGHTLRYMISSFTLACH